MLLIQHLLVNINLRKKIKKSVPPWWKIIKLDTLTSENRPSFKYRVWVELEIKDVDKSSREYLTYIYKRYGWVLLDRFGKIEEIKLNIDLDYNDKHISDDIKKQYNREKLLNELLN